MSLLPTRSDASTAADEANPRVVGVESEDADDLLSALSSDTARRLLGELHEEPAPPAELAERADTSLQNAQYHLENLEEAGAVSVVDTAYSQKGREMDVYAPADQPLVIFAGDQDDSTSIRTALTRLLGGLGVLAFASVLVQTLYGDGVGDLLPSLGSGDGAAPGGGDGGGAGTETGAAGGDGAGPAETPTPDTPPDPITGESGSPTDVATETATPTGNATQTATETATQTGQAAADVATAGVPPGALFFLGGATVLVAGFLVWYVRQ